MRPPHFPRRFGLPLASVLWLACSDAPPPAAPMNTVCIGLEDGAQCDGELFLSCDQGVARRQRDCFEEGLRCDPEAECRLCEPSTIGCDGATRQVCAADGQSWETLSVCGDGTQCSQFGCTDLCADAVETRSAIGCRYWPTVLPNPVLDAENFSFAVVVSNPALIDAHVEIRRGGSVVATGTIAPGALETFELPWVDALRGEPFDGSPSRVVRGGAYRLDSDVPVLAYQFNPLAFSGACVGTPCFSFTNDASVLVPDHLLADRYVAATRPTFLIEIEDRGNEARAGNLVIVGTTETPVEVEVASTSYVSAADDGAFQAMAPGESQTISLGMGDVLVVASAVPERCDGDSTTDEMNRTFCDTPREYDLTGSLVRASGPVAAFSGHECTFVPFDRWACDHLEEAMFPIRTWGDEVVVPRPVDLGGEPHVVRVVSGADGNLVRVDPSELAEEVTLDLGEFIEFEATVGATVRGSGAIQAVQFLYGQGGGNGSGDPAMSLGVPIEQFRRDFVFQAPATYSQQFLTVVLRSTTTLELDGRSVDTEGASTVGDFRSLDIEIEPGPHTLEASERVGAVLYGYARYTSYMLPVGFDSRELVTEIPF